MKPTNDEDLINTGDLYREHLLGSSIPDKVELIKKKIEQGYPMRIFHKSGNGLKVLLSQTGRLTDFSGIFIISSAENSPLILGDSNHVLQEIQKLIRGQRQKDQSILKALANKYNFKAIIGAQQFLVSSNVNWIEVADKTERVVLKRALRSLVQLVL